MFGKHDSEKADISNGQDVNAADYERELPPVNGAKKTSSKIIPLIFISLAAVFAAWLVFSMSDGSKAVSALKKKEAEDARRYAISGRVPEIKQPVLPPPVVDGFNLPSAPPDQVPAPTGVQNEGADEKPAWVLARERRMNSSLGADFEETQIERPNAQQKPSDPNADTIAAIERIYGNAGQGEASDNELESDGFVDSSAPLTNSLKPSRTVGTAAALVFDRNMLLAKGSFLDCTLETKLDSTVPGLTACVLARNIYSDNGKVVLLERGSRIIGEYQGGIKQGQSRIFVLWTRVQTPKGVVIDIDSPGTDSLGASGLDGFIDTQFWKRFGGAIMLSLIDDFAALATRDSQNQPTLQNSQDAAQQMGVEALKNSINIPPILRKNQGDHINIYVARDLDFRTVYALRSR